MKVWLIKRTIVYYFSQLNLKILLFLFDYAKNMPRIEKRGYENEGRFRKFEELRIS